MLTKASKGPLLLVCAALIAAMCAAVASALASPPRAHAAYAQQCRDPYPATRNPTNPLMLPTPWGANPLAGAQFFVDGPRHGPAAGAIARLLGVNPARYRDNYSWDRFNASLGRGSFAHKLSHNGALRYKIHLLQKIAQEPEANKFSRYSGGGGPGALFGQVQRLFCHNFTADPGAIPIITTYFLHPAVSACPTPDGCAQPAQYSGAASTRWLPASRTGRQCS